MDAISRFTNATYNVPVCTNEQMRLLASHCERSSLPASDANQGANAAQGDAKQHIHKRNSFQPSATGRIATVATVSRAAIPASNKTHAAI